MIKPVFFFVFSMVSCMAQESEFIYLVNPTNTSMTIVDANINDLTKAPDSFSDDYVLYETHAMPLIDESIIDEKLTLNKIVTSFILKINDQYFLAQIPKNIPNLTDFHFSKNGQKYIFISQDQNKITIKLTPTTFSEFKEL